MAFLNSAIISWKFSVLRPERWMPSSVLPRVETYPTVMSLRLLTAVSTASFSSAPSPSIMPFAVAMPWRRSRRSAKSLDM